VDATLESLGDVREGAVGWTVIKNVLVEDHSRPVSDSGPSYLASDVKD